MLLFHNVPVEDGEILTWTELSPFRVLWAGADAPGTLFFAALSDVRERRLIWLLRLKTGPGQKPLTVVKYDHVRREHEYRFAIVMVNPNQVVSRKNVGRNVANWDESVFLSLFPLGVTAIESVTFQIE